MMTHYRPATANPGFSSRAIQAELPARFSWPSIVALATVLAIALAAANAAESPVPVESAGAGGDAAESLYQMQLLQQEVMELRGQVEELKFRLERTKAVQEDRYLELDGRLQQLMAAQAATPSQPAPGANGTPDLEQAQTLSEKELYDASVQLARNNQHDEAITLIESLIDQFPDGEHTANAYFLLGQIYLLKSPPDYEEARQALTQVIYSFPDHRKVPEAMLYLGQAHYFLGDCARAEAILKQVVEQHQGKSVAKAAEKYLQDSMRCDR